MKLNSSDAKLLEHCVQELELRTRAEIVLVNRKSSGSYRDIAHLGGAFAAWCLLIVAMSVPDDIPENWVPLPMVAIFFIVSLTIKHSRLRTLLSAKKRKIRQVARSAHACFYEKKIHQTTAHSGILIYCSLLEQRAEIITDRTAELALDPARVTEFQNLLMSKFCTQKNHSEATRALLEVLRSFGVYLGKVLPATSTEKVNELSASPDLNEEDE
jgi:uncharacterized membrane protein